MSRPPRRDIVVPGLPHHVIIRGNNRRRIFSRSSDFQRFLWYLDRALERTGVHLHAYELLANHGHLIVTPESMEAMALMMKLACSRYAMYRNRNRAGSGKLFEERFRSIAITSDEQLQITTCYIEANAIRAGIVGDPAGYRWSSYALHAGLPVDDAASKRWTPSPWYLAQGIDAAERGSRYRALFDDYVRGERKPEHVDVIDKAEALSRVPYTRRLERPNRVRAMEPPASYGKLRGCPENDSADE